MRFCPVCLVVRLSLLPFSRASMAFRNERAGEPLSSCWRRRAMIAAYEHSVQAPSREVWTDLSRFDRVLVLQTDVYLKVVPGLRGRREEKTEHIHTLKTGVSCFNVTSTACVPQSRDATQDPDSVQCRHYRSAWTQPTILWKTLTGWRTGQVPTATTSTGSHQQQWK
ncbi:hypothetical protein BBK36DRAFT_1143129 [Trichoderma citrinoviride]|uniref:Secreted protein n=1 Tax=Trichoderma citrinoviride TaxID=58853 RepID=A0A2T4B4P4_9HYPO|nr:hypothetical protein BBK36DRAFT_1143129 [Trichoderma citrinoviride]PTB64303.1 hypothetical protein BBK36DRAFT_1143129 [Trichoderma citrinoviride]